MNYMSPIIYSIFIKQWSSLICLNLAERYVYLGHNTKPIIVNYKPHRNIMSWCPHKCKLMQGGSASGFASYSDSRRSVGKYFKTTASVTIEVNVGISLFSPIAI